MPNRGGTVIVSSTGIGTILAVVLSYHVNASILWAILHSFLGWIYVVYWIFEHSNLLNMISR